MRFLAIALLAVAAVSAVQAEDPNGVLDKSFPMQKRDNTEKKRKVYNEDGTVILSTPNESCEPLSHFKVNCNDCWCKSDGLGARCDTSACPDVTCKPGTVVRKDCDECVCKPSGKEMVCYTKHCDDDSDLRFQYTVIQV